MKFIKSIICCLAASASLVSCSDWLDVNDNPNTPSSVHSKIEQLLPWCQFYVTDAYAIQGYRSQFICQALTATSRTTRDGSSAQWNPSTALSTTPYQVFFVGAGPNLDDMYNKAMEKGAYHYAAAARILRAYGFALMTDIYGEMPYKEALGTTLTPKYDDGKSIYLGIIGEVEEAIELFGRQQAAGAPALADGDSWNGGDVGKWTKMAYLLKARLLNHMSKKAPGDYKDGKYDADEILACLAKAQGSNADNTELSHINIKENYSDILLGDPVQSCPTFACAGMGGGATTRPTQWLVDILTNFNNKGIEDPRADKILPWIQVNNPQKWQRSQGVEMRTANTIRLSGGPFALSRNATDKVLELKDKDNAVKVRVAPHSWYSNTTDLARQGDTVYVGFRSGGAYYSTTTILYNKYDDSYAETSSNVFCHPDSHTQWSTYSEACFIKAEVLFRQGKKPEAFNAYKEGIKANIDAIQSILTVWNGDATYSDIPAFKAMDQLKIDNFMNNAIGDANSLSLEDIMTQKFIAMLYTNENWNDMRRMDYSNYQDWKKPYEFSVNGTAQGKLPDGAWRRVMQCSHELNYNNTNLNAIFSQLGYGVSPSDEAGAVWGIPVWWDKAD